MSRPRFHLAFPVHDLAEARAFYGGILECKEGRSSEEWVDFDFFGHQISAHIGPRPEAVLMTTVAGTQVPLAHFGAVLEWEQWRTLADRLTAADAEFIIAPQVRFPDAPGEQGTFFVRDRSGNALEFKSFRHPDTMFEAAAADTAAPAGAAR